MVVKILELELDIVTLQSIEIKHNKDLINQTRAVLKKWKSEKCSNKQLNYPLKTVLFILHFNRGRHGSGHMIVGFTTTCAISAYHH
jgi:hypothetical protein